MAAEETPKLLERQVTCDILGFHQASRGTWRERHFTGQRAEAAGRLIASLQVFALFVCFYFKVSKRLGSCFPERSPSSCIFHVSRSLAGFHSQAESKVKSAGGK